MGLIELMVALAIGLLVVLGASAALLAGSRLFDTDGDAQATQDSLRFARHVIETAARQAGYVDFTPDHPAGGLGAVSGAAPLALAGARNTVVGGKDDGYGADDSDTAHGNDSLMVRFQGHSLADGSRADGTMVDCFGVPQPGVAAAAMPDGRVLNVFHLTQADDGEWELSCKYAARSGGDGLSYPRQPLVRGIEKLKLLYGLDTDADGVADSWLDAAAVAADGAGTPPEARWARVVALRVGLVARGPRPRPDLKRPAGVEKTIYPLGRAFAPDVHYDPPDDGRLRQVASFTLQLRNSVKVPA